MRLGEEVIHEGQRLVLRGLDPMSVADGRAEIEDPETGERTFVPIAELSLPLAAGVSGLPG